MTIPSFEDAYSYTAPNGRGRWPSRLCYLISERKWSEATDRVVSHPEEATKPTIDGWLPLHTACYACRATPHPEPPPANPPAGFPELLTELLRAHPEATRSENSWGCVPLHVAVTSAFAFPETARTLLDADESSADLKNGRGLAPLEWLCSYHGPTIDLATTMGGRVVGDDESSADGEGEGFVDFFQQPSEPVPLVDADGGVIGLHPEDASVADGSVNRYMFCERGPFRNELSRVRSMAEILLLWQRVSSSRFNHPDAAAPPLLHACAAMDRPCPDRLVRYAFAATVCPRNPAPRAAASSEPDDDGNLPLHVAASHRNGSRTVRRLLEAYPEAAAAANRHGMLPLHLALRSGMHWHSEDGNGGGVAEMIFEANMSAVEVPEPGTGLFPFMIVAIRKDDNDGAAGDDEEEEVEETAGPCLDAAFYLLRTWPQLESMRGGLPSELDH